MELWEQGVWTRLDSRAENLEHDGQSGKYEKD